MFGFNNAEPIDVGEANAKLREDCPGLLLEVIIKRYFVNFWSYISMFLKDYKRELQKILLYKIWQRQLTFPVLSDNIIFILDRP